MEHDPTKKGNKITKFAGKWMKPEIMSSKINQTKKEIDIFSFR